MEPLTCSRVGPVVEGSIGQLVDMVKHVGRAGNMTESQNRRMVTYLGNLDEMRGQIVIMIQRYEDDGKVLKRLLDLVDRIDDVKQLALKAEESLGDERAMVDDKDIPDKYDTPFNPLMVSTLNILDASGLFASRIRDEDEAEAEEEGEKTEEEEDAFWDHQDDPSLIAPEEQPQDASSINLSVSNIFLPSLFDSSSAVPLIANATLCHHTPSSPSPQDNKGKGKSTDADQTNNLSVSDANLPSLFDSTLNAAAVSKATVDRKGKGKAKAKEADRKGKGKGKGKLKEIRFTLPDESEGTLSSSGSGSASESERMESDSEKEKDGAEQPKKPTFGWRRTLPSAAAPHHRSSSSATASSSSSAMPRPHASHSSSSSDSASESESESSSTGSSMSLDTLLARLDDNIPQPPPMPKNRRGHKKKKKTGPMDAPVLCKICYDEYDRWESVHKFDECEHTYCCECLSDYLSTNISEGAVLDLVCPFPDCETEILPAAIQSLCTPEIYTKYERFTVLAALRADPNARWCPNPYCNNGIKYNAATMPWVHCNECKFEFCYHCMAERHDGVACGKEALDFLQKKKESEAAAFELFSEWTGVMKAKVKPCPTCKAYIEKNDGCNHMTCGNPTCRTQFCWLCLAVYTDEHFIDDINFPDCYDKQYWTEVSPDSYAAPYNAPRRRRFANIAKKVGIYMGVGVAVVTLGVPAAVIGGPVYGCFQLHKRLKRARARRAPRSSYHGDALFVPPSPARIAEAQREARRLYELEHS